MNMDFHFETFQHQSKKSPEAKTFVDGLLQKKPEKRYTIKEVLEHPWIKKMDKVPEKRKDNKNKSHLNQTMNYKGNSQKKMWIIIKVK